MPQVAPHVSTGLNWETGQVLVGWPHVVQSLSIIFTTRFGERVMREWFGSFVPNMLGKNIVPSTQLKFWTAVCVAIDLWEPRFRVTQIIPRGSPEQLRSGALGYTIHGTYYPRGHLGDYSVTEPRSVDLYRDGKVITA